MSNIPVPPTSRRERPSPPSLPQGGDGSARSPAQVALGDMGDLASHNRLANLQLRDRAIAEAARLKALIKLFGSLPEATGFPSRKEREKQCEEWQAAVEKITTTAVILTLEAQQLGPGMREFVEREVRREITEAPLPPNLADQLSAYRRYNAAALRPILEFVDEQQNNHPTAHPPTCRVCSEAQEV
jgi:hypothetical protein